jgi:hypothetical protein
VLVNGEGINSEGNILKPGPSNRGLTTFVGCLPCSRVYHGILASEGLGASVPGENLGQPPLSGVQAVGRGTPGIP